MSAPEGPASEPFLSLVIKIKVVQDVRKIERQADSTPESGSSLSAVRRRLQKIRSTLFWTTFVKYTDDIWPT